MSTAPVLSVRQLSIASTGDRARELVAPMSFDLHAGEALGIVGESGSGKSLTLRAVLGLLPPSLSVAGTISGSAAAGGPIGSTAMIFQEPATALNPTLRVGDFVARTWRLHHRDQSRKAATAATLDLFEQVGIADPARRAAAWPHELSGGLRQRVMIAAALATEPDVLLCDEPTTALDVRVQAQIIDLLASLREQRQMAMLFVSHDLAVVGSLCQRIMVMRAGEVLETGTAHQVLHDPAHEYSRSLIAATLTRRPRRTTTTPEAQ